MLAPHASSQSNVRKRYRCDDVITCGIWHQLGLQLSPWVPCLMAAMLVKVAGCPFPSDMIDILNRDPGCAAGDAATLVVTTQASSIRVFQAQHPGEAAWVQTASTTLPGSITGLGLTGNITGSIAGQHIILQLSPDPGPPSELSHTSPGHILLMDITTCSTAHRWHVLGAPRSTQLLPSSGIRLVTADIGHLQQLLEVQLLTCTAVGGMCVLTARLPFPAEEQEGAGQVER